MSDLVVSWIRTAAAVLAGGLITWAVRQGLLADSSVTQPLTEVLVVAFTAAWYFLVRVLEHLWPAFGFFLGVPKAPSYTQTAGQPTGQQGGAHSTRSLP